jgi:hypothetical protein
MAYKAAESSDLEVHQAHGRWKYVPSEYENIQKLSLGGVSVKAIRVTGCGGS